MNEVLLVWKLIGLPVCNCTIEAIALAWQIINAAQNPTVACIEIGQTPIPSMSLPFCGPIQIGSLGAEIADHQTKRAARR